jgi:hypothetical protein
MIPTHVRLALRQSRKAKQTVRALERLLLAMASLVRAHIPRSREGPLARLARVRREDVADCHLVHVDL